MITRIGAWSTTLVPAALAASLTLTPLPAAAQSNPAGQADPAPQAKQGDWPIDRHLLALGMGAVMGAVTFNLLAAPLGTVPLAGAALEAVPSNVAVGSRLIAVTAAGAGAFAANWLYGRWAGTQSDYRYLATLGVGALAGVAVGNYLTAGTVGYVPYYAGAGVANAAGVMTSAASQAASRVYVIASGVLGAWVADYMYRR